MTKNSSQLCAQLYTLRDYTKTPAELSDTLKKVAAIGYKAVQVSAVGPIDPVELKKLLDENCLELTVTHTDYTEFSENLSNVIKNHLLWDCKYAGLGSMPRKYSHDKEGFTAFMNEANVWAKELNKNGIKFVYHNHSHEFVRFDGMNGYDYMIENAGEGFQFELDTFWVQAGGADPAAYINKLKGKMDILHLKDFDISSDGSRRMREIGEGNLNWSSILEACKNIGIKRYIVEQDECNGLNPFDCLATSYRNLKKMGLE